MRSDLQHDRDEFAELGLRRRQDVKRVAVEGHTDERGSRSAKGLGRPVMRIRKLSSCSVAWTSIRLCKNPPLPPLACTGSAGRSRRAAAT